MYLSADTLDDLLMRVLERLLKIKGGVKASRGSNTEMFGVLLQLTNPRARLSHSEKKGKVFSALGELLWYLAKTDDLKFIRYYLRKYEKESDDGRTLWGAYGPRLFAMRRRTNQVSNVLKLLRAKPSSRRAVIQLFNAEDLVDSHKEIPCTCTLQFVARSNRLHMLTYMRSNDAFIGLPHDVFAFTMLQEIVARDLGLELGVYKHCVGSLHLYDENRDDARQYVAEGWQPTDSVQMPPMPRGSQWPSIEKVLAAEAKIRRGYKVKSGGLALDPFWSDVVRLLQIFRHVKRREYPSIRQLQKQMHSDVYSTYIAAKQEKLSVPRHGQLALPFPEVSDEDDDSVGG